LAGAGLSLGYLICLTLLPLFSFRGYIKDDVYIALLATNLPELVGRIRDEAATVTHDLLNNM
jgi:hypothetical protein